MTRTYGTRRSSVLVGFATVFIAALLAVGQAPAAADDAVDSSAWTYQDTGQFQIWVGAHERYDYLCLSVRKVATDEWHWVCPSGQAVFVDDLLESATARGGGTWSYTTYPSNNGKGTGAQKSQTTRGTLSADLTWTQNGPTTVSPDASYVPPYGFPFSVCEWWWYRPRCNPGYLDITARRERPATVTGTVTDSAWGTFSFSGTVGSLGDYVVSF